MRKRNKDTSHKNKDTSHKLEEVVLRELGVRLNKEHQKSNWSGDLAPDMLEYAAVDSKILLPLLETFEPRIEQAHLERVLEIEHRALPAMVWMSGAGVPFDAEGWRKRLKELEEERSTLLGKVNELAPEHPGGGEWNWNSSKQVKEAFGLIGIKLENTREETLNRYDHPLARALLEYRRVSKLTSTYGEKLLEKVEGGRIYPSWHQIGAQTGRMACSKPNLQQLPPAVRRHVRAPEGKALIKADYSQIELRIAAKVSGDKRMLEAFSSGEDIHTITASSLTGREEVTKEERKLAKAINFGLLYGMSPSGLKNYARANYGVEMSAEEAEHYWQSFFETYPGLKSWHDREYRRLKQNATETRTLTGRRACGIEKLTERLNFPVQGTGADGLKLALALLYERRDEYPGAVPILAVHDEIVVECDEADAEKASEWLRRAMVDGMERVLNASATNGQRVPVEVESAVGRSWTGE